MIEKHLSIKKLKLVSFICLVLCIFQININRNYFYGNTSFSNFHKYAGFLGSNKIDSLFFYPPENYSTSSDGKWHPYFVYANKPVLNTVSKINNAFVVETLNLSAIDLASLLSNLSISHLFVNDEITGSKFIDNPYYVLIDRFNSPSYISGVKRASLYKVLPPSNSDDFIYTIFNDFYELEASEDFNFRWSGSNSSICFYGKEGSNTLISLNFKSIFRNDTIQIKYKEMISDLLLTNKSISKVSIYADTNSCIYLKSSKVATPKSLNINEDNRRLSFLVYTD